MDITVPEGLALLTLIPASQVDSGTTHWVTAERPVFYVRPGHTAVAWGLDPLWSVLRYYCI